MKTFIIEQKVTVMANQYRVFEADAAGTKGKQLAFAHQKRLTLKEHFTFYNDDSKRHEVFSVRARKVIDLGARYDVVDEYGKELGVLGKAFKSSLLRSTWNVFKPGEESEPLVIARERNPVLAVVRRVWELLPFFGDIPFFVKYHFDFVRPSDERRLASYTKTTTFRDHYRLEIDDELADSVDWRVLVALGVMMDALQSR